MGLVSSEAVNVHNRLVMSGKYRAILIFLSSRFCAFDSFKFIESLQKVKAFPAVTIREVVSAAESAGAYLSPVKIGFDELKAATLPLLTYVRDPATGTAELVMLEAIRGRWASMKGTSYLSYARSLEDLAALWTGLCLIAKDPDAGISEELRLFDGEIGVVENFISYRDCKNLIDLCENEAFRRSKVLSGDAEGEGRVSARIRSSSSVTLTNRNNPILREIYRRVADLEGVNERLIETIQAVRYKRSQRFLPHYDGSVGLPRRRTYLVYLNDNFEGGETIFPLLNRGVSPRAGSYLKFSSCARDGRILWPSEHGGAPIAEGIKYALNVWVRCPV